MPPATKSTPWTRSRRALAGSAWTSAGMPRGRAGVSQHALWATTRSCSRAGHPPARCCSTSSASSASCRPRLPMGGRGGAQAEQAPPGYQAWDQAPGILRKTEPHGPTAGAPSPISPELPAPRQSRRALQPNSTIPPEGKTLRRLAATRACWPGRHRRLAAASRIRSRRPQRTARRAHQAQRRIDGPANPSKPSPAAGQGQGLRGACGLGGGSSSLGALLAARETLHSQSPGTGASSGLEAARQNAQDAPPPPPSNHLHASRTPFFWCHRYGKQF
mmetsp:Transcript_7209/g.17292  ORF Transcript_7209/g.17292 Transcript_7209/m.17292 type:complete len:275 (-) Transcript_7209:29-853(-)